MSFKQLKNIDRQKKLIEHNTRCFVEGLPANNVLLTGERGTGKSSLVKACLQQFHADGLRLVEIDKDHLSDLPHLIELLPGSSFNGTKRVKPVPDDLDKQVSICELGWR
ncbi:AAA ATPase superfamily protein [Pseudomonas sp. CFII64]|uniref:DUF815 domain-containing protein n=1 Tax=Pseudomonas sp. CFII64 TaxID=911242 RepID=UPI00035728D3|nr:DUF815 domain-containing protein [Pseudomonas sp. CFII64]EPJ76913.1 AAA ATPase superfamily protein [Pseudomonas sp. CFII64]